MALGNIVVIATLLIMDKLTLIGIPLQMIQTPRRISRGLAARCLCLCSYRCSLAHASYLSWFFCFLMDRGPSTHPLNLKIFYQESNAQRSVCSTMFSKPAKARGSKYPIFKDPGSKNH